jgi:hypothetical protein
MVLRSWVGCIQYATAVMAAGTAPASAPSSVTIQNVTRPPSFVAQWGPLIAALVALSGVMLSLYVTGRREELRRSEQARDDYNREQRTAVAAVATAAHELGRAAAVFGDVERLRSEGYESATGMRDAVHDAAGELLNALTVANLLIHDSHLQARLDEVLEAFPSVQDAALVVFRAYRDDPNGDLLSVAAALERCWPRFDKAVVDLHEDALRLLAPAIVARAGSGR